MLTAVLSEVLMHNMPRVLYGMKRKYQLLELALGFWGSMGVIFSFTI
jgi:hypothetical protein